jgi:hypothetical protein
MGEAWSDALRLSVRLVVLVGGTAVASLSENVREGRRMQRSCEETSMCTWCKLVVDVLLHGIDHEREHAISGRPTNSLKVHVVLLGIECDCSTLFVLPLC